MARRRPKPPSAVRTAPSIFDDVAVALVHRASNALCRRRGFSWADREDIVQALFFALHRAVRKFDPARTSWRSFAAAVVARRAATLARNHRSPKRVPPAAVLTHVDPARDERRPMPPADPGETVPLAIDVDQALASAPLNLRALAERLMAGERVTAAARDLGIARSTARGWVGQLRRRFEDLRLLDG